MEKTPNQTESIIAKKNELCTEFAKEWVTYFDENFPWNQLDWVDAYLTIMMSIGNLFANYGSSDLTTALTLIDNGIDKMKNNIISEMNRQLKERNPE